MGHREELVSDSSTVEGGMFRATTMPTRRGREGSTFTFESFTDTSSHRKMAVEKLIVQPSIVQPTTSKSQNPICFLLDIHHSFLGEIMTFCGDFEV